MPSLWGVAKGTLEMQTKESRMVPSPSKCHSRLCPVTTAGCHSWLTSPSSNTLFFNVCLSTGEQKTTALWVHLAPTASLFSSEANFEGVFDQFPRCIDLDFSSFFLLSDVLVTDLLLLLLLLVFYFLQL